MYTCSLATQPRCGAGARFARAWIVSCDIIPQGKAREAEVERINARTIEDDMADATLDELDELEDELADDGMLEKYR